MRKISQSPGELLLGSGDLTCQEKSSDPRLCLRQGGERIFDATGPLPTHALSIKIKGHRNFGQRGRTKRDIPGEAKTTIWMDNVGFRKRSKAIAVATTLKS